ncbi:MAG: hypothetical protein J3K34DRAFT_47322, partial [Monoraphidium minutum]
GTQREAGPWPALCCSYISRAPCSTLHLPLPTTPAAQQRTTSSHGPHQADGPQVHRRQGAPQAAGHQGRAQVGARHRRREEAPQVQAWYRGAARDPQVPEEHRAADPQAAFPAPGARDRPGLQDRPALPVQRRAGAAGGRRGLPGGPL